MTEVNVNREQLSEQRFNRLSLCLALCDEFSHFVRLNLSGEIVTLVHEKWLRGLEERVRPIGWRFDSMKNWGPFRILVLVDSFR